MAAMASGASVLLALAVAGAGAVSAAGAILVLAVGLGLYARHWLSLAERSRGDIDSLAIAPTGVAYVVETKTRTYDPRHLARVREQAAWLSRRRRRWCRRGALPVVCLVRPRGIERVEREVLVLSIDRLIPVLRSGAAGLGRSADELGMRGRIGQRGRLE
jgi:hypothetical protein